MRNSVSLTQLIKNNARLANDVKSKKIKKAQAAFESLLRHANLLYGHALHQSTDKKMRLTFISDAREAYAEIGNLLFFNQDSSLIDTVFRPISENLDVKQRVFDRLDPQITSYGHAIDELNRAESGLRTIDESTDFKQLNAHLYKAQSVATLLSYELSELGRFTQTSIVKQQIHLVTLLYADLTEMINSVSSELSKFLPQQRSGPIRVSSGQLEI